MTSGGERSELEEVSEIFLPIFFLQGASGIFMLPGVALAFSLSFLNPAERAVFRFLPAAHSAPRACSHPGASSAALPGLRPSILSLFLQIKHISILKHYATLYVCVAGKKLLSDTHWCY